MKTILIIIKYILLSVILLFSSAAGHIRHNETQYYSKAEIDLYTANAKTAQGNGEIILIGGGFDTEKQFKPLIDECISHSGKQNPKMLFVPTAHFDNLHETEEIVEWFKNAGCETDILLVSRADENEIREKIENADIVYATGGNLKFLSETWSQKDVFNMMKTAFLRGAVLMGPSSGAMCWAQRGWDCCGEDVFRITDSFPFLGYDASYDYYDCAGMIPFCVCPHFDNVAWRVFAFNAAELDIPSICIENGAAVIYCNGNYSVISDSKTPFKTAYLFVPDRNIYMLDIKQNSEFVKLADGECKN